jgi:hypothetical protein
MIGRNASQRPARRASWAPWHYDKGVKSHVC